jgi:hypothetical protein
MPQEAMHAGRNAIHVTLIPEPKRCVMTQRETTLAGKSPKQAWLDINYR